MNGVEIKKEVTNREQYWIERHRYYELKHFCLQYPIWKSSVLASTEAGKAILVSALTFEADPALSSYLLKGVTQGI